MNIGKAILSIRKEKKMSQEEFGQLFHVTRQTVSNWENEKSYPDLQTLINMSDMFDISLDKLLKEDKQMVKSMSKIFTDGLKWGILKKVAVSLVTIVVILGIAYACIWNSSKKVTETKFQEGIEANGFEFVDKGYYVLNTTDDISFMLPNQEMPPLRDFSLDFHAKHLDAELKIDKDTIVIRWLDENELWLSVEWDNKDGNYSSYRIDENGVFLTEEADGTKLAKVEKNIEEVCKEYQNEIQSVIKQGNKIYQSVYR